MNAAPTVTPSAEVSVPAFSGGGPPALTAEGPSIVIPGAKFGRLTVLSRAPSDPHHNPYWFVQCSCGVTKRVSAGKLRQGTTRSCGCIRRDQAKSRYTANLLGQKFGRALAVKKVSSCKSGARWLCLCDCGTSFVASACHLKSGHTNSCGCYCRDQTSKANRDSTLTVEERTRRRLGRFGDEAMAATSQQVRIRDGFRCLNCGRHGSVDVHHVMPYARHEELRYEKSNMVCLCRRCHIRFHVDFGRTDCDLDDLEEFLTEEQGDQE